jgi:hypothetical protein
MKTASLNIVIDAVADILMQRQALGLPITEWTVERVLIDEVGWERAEELLDRILIDPVIRETIDVANMDFSESEILVSAGGCYFEIPGGTAAYMRDAL